MPIEIGKLYSPPEIQSEGLARVQTLAQWRHEQRGPAYTKAGSRVIYRGEDIIHWLEKNRVEPSA